ncbi:hypothetical protein GCM10010885_23830 [Alicyclobacillus cellulosilyticus]|uniref:Uncharacterized protein n=1 Tax=Alicyclobacillus cellulosilyticus TaxID=1003997 RepID=A0A917KH20_9BACL|nr:hypothetical protein GCM10010885_23830 [Alicyclobacillus cellulosilyticus]
MFCCRIGLVKEVRRGFPEGILLRQPLDNIKLALKGGMLSYVSVLVALRSGGAPAVTTDGGIHGADTYPPKRAPRWRTWGH